MSHDVYPNETNGIGNLYGTDEGRKLLDEVSEHACLWTDRRLVKITRLRMLTDPGFPMWDISYVHGLMNVGGELVHCRVSVPFAQLGRKTWWSEIKMWARADNVNLSKLGVWDAVSKLW